MSKTNARRKERQEKTRKYTKRNKNTRGLAWQRNRTTNRRHKTAIQTDEKGLNFLLYHNFLGFVMHISFHSFVLVFFIFRDFIFASILIQWLFFIASKMTFSISKATMIIKWTFKPFCSFSFHASPSPFPATLQVLQHLSLPSPPLPRPPMNDPRGGRRNEWIDEQISEWQGAGRGRGRLLRRWLQWRLSASDPHSELLDAGLTTREKWTSWRHLTSRMKKKRKRNTWRRRDCANERRKYAKYERIRSEHMDRLQNR